MKVPWAIDPVHIYVIRDKTRLSGESVETQLSKYRRFISCCLDELCWNSSMVSDKSLSEHVLLPHSLDNCLLISRFDDERFDEMTINNQRSPDVWFYSTQTESLDKQEHSGLGGYLADSYTVFQYNSWCEYCRFGHFRVILISQESRFELFR